MAKGNRVTVKEIVCPRCGRLMTAILSRDAGWLPMTDSGHADGNEVLGYCCMRDDCLEGAYGMRKAA